MTNLPERCSRLAQIQHGVIARKQALECGMSADSIDYLVKSERWQRIYPGVFAIFTGPPSRMAQLWAAVLLAGRDAALSHDTAAELHAYGSVLRVVTRQGLVDAAYEVAEMIAAKSPTIIRRAKESLNGIDPVDVKRSYRYEQGFTYVSVGRPASYTAQQGKPRKLVLS